MHLHRRLRGRSGNLCGLHTPLHHLYHRLDHLYGVHAQLYTSWKRMQLQRSIHSLGNRLRDVSLSLQHLRCQPQRVLVFDMHTSHRHGFIGNNLCVSIRAVPECQQGLYAVRPELLGMPKYCPRMHKLQLAIALKPSIKSMPACM